MRSFCEKYGKNTPFHAVAKQLFGRKYERISRSLMLCLILFLAVYASELRVQVSPAVLYLTAAVFSAGIMWRTLNSSQNAEIFMGLFMLPFDDREMMISYAAAFGGYTLITKTAVVLALFFTAAQWSAAEIGAAVLLACLGCVLSAGLYAAVHMDKEGAYVFFQPSISYGNKRHTGRKGYILRYLLRYITSNKNYLVNTAGLWLIAGLLPLMLGQFDGLNTLPMGFAILCMNTPICILLSCDPDLEQAVRLLPEQSVRFCGAYGLFIALVNFTGSSVYLVSWQVIHGGIGIAEVLTAAGFAAASAALSVYLEWRYPIRGWKIENDLWHHPRKYIVPVVMLLAGAVAGM
ncbi:hypothetical protein D3Z62_20005 [Lachnospiraceae bacterium]|nr:hypothetical protein [Lachnospiraceae bacterium]